MFDLLHALLMELAVRTRLYSAPGQHIYVINGSIVLAVFLNGNFQFFCTVGSCGLGKPFRMHSAQ